MTYTRFRDSHKPGSSIPANTANMERPESVFRDINGACIVWPGIGIIFIGRPDIILPVIPGTIPPVIPGTTLPVIPGTTLPVIPGTTLPVIPGTTLPIIPGTPLPIIRSGINICEPYCNWGIRYWPFIAICFGWFNIWGGRGWFRISWSFAAVNLRGAFENDWTRKKDTKSSKKIRTLEYMNEY